MPRDTGSRRRSERLDRRDMIKALGVAGMVGFAGCGGGGGDGNSDGGGGTPTPTEGGDMEDGGSTATPTQQGAISGSIPMGSILPLSGALKQYGSGMQEAVKIAVEDINNAGGPGGANVELTTKNSETSPQKAKSKYNSLVNQQNIVGFVGAASSGVSTTLAQNVAADEVMEVSNASTSPVLTNIGYKTMGGEKLKFFARTAPSDGQQGVVMGRFIMGQDKYIGADTAAFLHVGNAYGKGLANTAAKEFPGETLNTVAYSKKTSDYTSVLSKVHEGNPDAIGFVGYPENGATILQQWSNQDFGTSADQWVLSEGVNSKEFLSNNADIVSDMYLATPDPKGKTQSLQTFKEKIGEANTLFAPHAYDAMFLMGLAMHKAGEASGPAIASNIQAVSAQPGEKVYAGEFGKAKTKLDNGKQIDYVGASSPVNLNSALQPLNPFAVLQVQSDGSTKKLQRIKRNTFMG